MTKFIILIIILTTGLGEYRSIYNKASILDENGAKSVAVSVEARLVQTSRLGAGTIIVELMV